MVGKRQIEHMKNLREVTTLIFITLFAGSAWACEKTRVSLQILGSGGPELNDQRASSSYIIWLDNKATILVDTGSGSSLNFERSGAKIDDLQAILFTHFHVDHSADFPAYVKGSFFTSREENLLIYGPDGNDVMPSTTEFVQEILSEYGAYKYLSNYVEPIKPSRYKIETNDVPLKQDQVLRYKLPKDVNISAIAVHHGPLAAIAWRVDAYGCSISFSGDMSNRYKTLVDLAKDSNILVAHNAIPENARGVARNLHMPPTEIGKIAKEANIKKLVISHRMQRTLGKEQETKTLIQNAFRGPIVFADDMDKIYLH